MGEVAGDRVGTRSNDGQNDAGVTVRELCNRVDGLRAELQALQLAMADQLRTGKIVVVDEDGVERIDISATSEVAEIVVRSRRAGPGTTAVIISAHDGHDLDPGHLSIGLAEDGDVVAGISLVAGQTPEWWGEPGAADGSGVTPTPSSVMSASTARASRGRPNR